MYWNNYTPGPVCHMQREEFTLDLHTTHFDNKTVACVVYAARANGLTVVVLTELFMELCRDSQAYLD